RPLSDIREMTEPSLIDTANTKPISGHSQIQNDRNSRHRSNSRTRSVSRKSSLRRRLSGKTTRATSPGNKVDGEARGRRSPVLSPGSQRSRASVYNIPVGAIPTRSVSQDRHSPPLRKQNLVLNLPPPRGFGYSIPNRGQSNSPVRHIAERLDPIASNGLRRAPSRTFIRTVQPNDILDYPTHRHPRVSAELHLSAGLFVGGGSMEGHVRLVIDDIDRLRHKRALALARISVDLLGIEELSESKRSIFLNLATELVDSENPPPHGMVESLKQISPIDPFWLMTPSSCVLPFLLSLPLDVGPPPFQSKHAKIRYSLSVTLLIREAGRQYLVRTSQDVAVLSVYDPEKALMSLPSPLTASDEWIKQRDSSQETIRLTAGLHRQVWVSGTCIFIDIHIANHSRKSVKKLELQLERDILTYKHAAASTLQKSASQARIFDSNERSIITRQVTKSGTNGWSGVSPHSNDIRTCDLDLPRGHATVKCGKYFEVRYFINIIASSSRTKLVTVQLPIVLIHMNSLDVVPNSVAQVAAAIEEKRGGERPFRSYSRHSGTGSPRVSKKTSRSVQGRAFAAPRIQSLDRARSVADDLRQIGQIIQHSPRRYQQIRHVRHDSEYKYHTPPSNRKGRVLEDEAASLIKRQLRHVRSNETNKTNKTGVASMLNRRGTASALGFREAEVEEDMKLAGL
ncbi:hypothetical protein M501DRAFT_912549, partial [Patellaria atrata CBS 101060]